MSNPLTKLKVLVPVEQPTVSEATPTWGFLFNFKLVIVIP